MISLLEGKGGGGAKEVEKTLQLHLLVLGCHPPIWRRLLIRETMWLSRLHDAIQLCFDWFDYQTHAFVIRQDRYGNPLKRDDFVIHDDRDVQIKDLNLETGSRFTYGYHFGTGWQLDIHVEQIIPIIKRKPYPVCLAGERCGPPEDCGGVDAYQDMLACIREPHSDLGREWLDWLGPDYDSERCDLDAMNRALRKLNK